jgi:hypothetical protein
MMRATLFTLAAILVALLGAALYQQHEKDANIAAADAQAGAERYARDVQKARADQLACVAVQRLYVDGVVWHALTRNTCDKPTERRIYIRLAFYDGARYRDGFITFGVEPLAAGERARMDAVVPRLGAVTARVFAVTDDLSVAAGW